MPIQTARQVSQWGCMVAEALLIPNLSVTLLLLQQADWHIVQWITTYTENSSQLAKNLMVELTDDKWLQLSMYDEQQVSVATLLHPC